MGYSNLIVITKLCFKNTSTTRIFHTLYQQQRLQEGEQEERPLPETRKNDKWLGPSFTIASTLTKFPKKFQILLFSKISLKFSKNFNFFIEFLNFHLNFLKILPKVSNLFLKAYQLLAREGQGGSVADPGFWFGGEPSAINYQLKI